MNQITVDCIDSEKISFVTDHVYLSLAREIQPGASVDLSVTCKEYYKESNSLFLITNVEDVLVNPLA